MAGDTKDAIASANAGAAVLCAGDRPDASAVAMTKPRVVAGAGR